MIYAKFEYTPHLGVADFEVYQQADPPQGPEDTNRPISKNTLATSYHYEKNIFSLDKFNEEEYAVTEFFDYLKHLREWKSGVFMRLKPEQTGKKSQYQLSMFYAPERGVKITLKQGGMQTLGGSWKLGDKNIKWEKREQWECSYEDFEQWVEAMNMYLLAINTLI